MRTPIGRLLCAAIVLVATFAVASLPASADPGPGTFTRITTPGTTTYFTFDPKPGATDNHFTVSGTTSPDVTSVDIDCFFYGADGEPDFQSFAEGIPVTDGAFSTVAAYSRVSINCRLRALPTGVPNTDFLGSYYGPLLYTSTVEESVAGTTPYNLTAISEYGDGLAEITSAGDCGVQLMTTITTPDMETRSPGQLACLLNLPAANLAANGSAVTVDGRNAYLPSAVHDFLLDDLSLPVTQSPLTIHAAAGKNGNLTVTESAPLMRCSVSNTYPPTMTSCPQLVATGVTFLRVSSMLLGDHQVQFRDSFVSTDHAAHHLTVEYQGALTPSATGSIGYLYPNHGSRFTSAGSGTVVTGLGSNAGTMFIRSDIDAGDGDLGTDAMGLSWSRAPATIRYALNDDFALPYSVTVPASKTAYLGFAMSEYYLAAQTSHLAGIAVGAMISPPRITSPRKAAKVRGKTTTVKGVVSLGANGLATSVTVNGHQAHLSPAESSEKFKATFTEAFGTHKITVRAVDAAHNSASATTRIRNVRR
jgi:hypothetical protein